MKGKNDLFLFERENFIKTVTFEMDLEGYID